MGYPITQNQTATPLVFLMVDSTDHLTGKTGLTPTVTISKNGGSFASPSGTVSEIGNGYYKVAGNATDENTLGPLLLHAEASGADDTDDEFFVVAHNVLDAVRLGLTALPNANAAANGGLPTVDGSNRVAGVQGTKNTFDDLNDINAAGVNAEVDTALADYAGPTLTQMAAAFTEIKGATWNSGTDTLEAIRDNQAGSAPTTGDIATAVWAAKESVNLIADQSGVTIGTVNAATLADGAHGGASTTITLQTPIQANTVQISGDATAADNLELMYDGTGYNAANSTIGTVTDWTNAATVINARIVAYGLDHLVSAAADFDTDIADDSIIAQLVSDSATADASDFDNTTDSLARIGSKTNLITIAPIVVETTLDGGNITIFQGESRTITIYVDGTTLPLSGHTPKIAFTKITDNTGSDSVEVTGTLYDADTAGQYVVFVIPKASTAGMALDTKPLGQPFRVNTDNAYTWQAGATDGADSCPTFSTGYASVNERGITC